MAKKAVLNSDFCKDCKSCTVSFCPAISRTDEGKPDILDKEVCSDCGDCVADCKGNPKAFYKK